LRRAGDVPKRLNPLETSSGRFVLRSPWPDLVIPAKDVEAHQSWCVGVEEVLAEAFHDARCPYRFLDPRKHAPHLAQVQCDLAASQAWGFREFLRECDFPDDEKFAEWCEAMQERQHSKRQAEA